MRFLAILAVLLSGLPAGAALITYEYTGNPWDFVHPFDDTDPLWHEGHTPLRDLYTDPAQSYFQASFTVDTSMLQISNTAFSDYVCAPWDAADGFCQLGPIVDLSFSDGVSGIDGVGWIFADFTTDSAGNLTSWYWDILDDPTAMVLSSEFGDVHTTYELDFPIVASSSPGTWAMVPVPAPLGLIAASLLALGLMRRISAQAKARAHVSTGRSRRC